MNSNQESRNGFVVILTTLENHAQAKSLAEKLVEARLAACVQIDSPIDSFYWWDGKVESSREHRLVIKSTEELGSKVVDFISANHPYEIPQIVTLPVVSGLESYFQWMNEQLLS